MPRRAVIVGRGGFGREAYAWYRDAVPDAAVVGFIEDDAASVGVLIGDVPVVGPVEWLADNPVDDVVMGVGAPAGRRALTERVRATGHDVATVVHPTAVVGSRVSIGTGSILCPGVVVTTDVDIGEGALLNLNVTIGHDCRIGSWTVLAPGVDVAGNVTLGPGCDVGIGASIIQRVTVGAGTVVGASAAVVRDLPSHVTAVGVPARPIKEHAERDFADV